MKKINSKTLDLLKKHLINLGNIEPSLARKDANNPELLKLWKGLVRDSGGRWLKYYFEGYKYFQYGIQPKPNLENSNNVVYIKTAIDQQRNFIQGLINQDIEDFRTWLISLHKKQIYNGNDIKTAAKKRFALIIHSKIVLDAVIPLAKRYHDPYANKGTQFVYLPKIAKKGLPKDVWDNEKEVFHYYSDPSFLPQYLSIMEEILQQIITTSHVGKELLSKIALYYQYAINTHMFEHINQSLFANQTNALLQVFGYEPINHGILDFVAMRLQPANFVKYFIDEVKSRQKPKKLISRSNKDENRYLRLSNIK